MSLIAEGRGGGQEEGTCDHCCDERQAEEEERVAGEGGAVGGCEGVLEGFGDEFLGLECWHLREDVV